MSEVADRWEEFLLFLEDGIRPGTKRPRPRIAIIRECERSGCSEQVTFYAGDPERTRCKRHRYSSKSMSDAIRDWHQKKGKHRRLKDSEPGRKAFEAKFKNPGERAAYFRDLAQRSAGARRARPR